MTDFFRPVVHKTDQPVAEETEVLQLSLADQIKLAEAILNPPEPSKALIRAFDRRKRLIR